MNVLQLKLIGFSFHVGSGCKSVESYYNAIKTCKSAYELAIKNNVNITIIDIGGGFPGIHTENSINIEEISEKINQAQHDFFSKEILIPFLISEIIDDILYPVSTIIVRCNRPDW